MYAATINAFRLRKVYCPTFEGLPQAVWDLEMQNVNNVHGTWDHLFRFLDEDEANLALEAWNGLLKTATTVSP